MKYPNEPGYKAEGTSRRAAEIVNKRSRELRTNCLIALGDRELTADEVAKRLQESPFSIRPRFTELKRMGAIQSTGEKRRSVNGVLMNVWRAL